MPWEHRKTRRCFVWSRGNTEDPWMLTVLLLHVHAAAASVCHINGNRREGRGGLSQCGRTPGKGIPERDLLSELPCAGILEGTEFS